MASLQNPSSFFSGGGTISGDITLGGNLELDKGRSLTYPSNPGIQTLVNVPVTDASSTGEDQRYSFDIDGETILSIEAESDGIGGITSKLVRVPEDFEVTGATSQVDDIITGNITIQDAGGNIALEVDATATPQLLDLHGINVRNVGGAVGAQSGALRLASTTSIKSRNAGDTDDVRLLELGNSDIIQIGESTAQGAEINNDLEFTSLVDSPTFSGHTHDEGGLTAIPNTGLANNRITINLGDALQTTGNGILELGDTETFSVAAGDLTGQFIGASGSPADLDVNISDGLEGDGSDNIRIQGDAISDGFLSEGTNPHQISVNIGAGIEGDGSNNLRVRGDAIAGVFLSEGTTPEQVTVDISRGLENDGSNSIQIDEDTDFTFTSAIDFSAGLDTQGSITDGTQVIWDVSAQEIPDSALGSIDNVTLTNSSLTINANDGLKSGGTVSLGDSIGLDIEPADFAGAFLSDDGTDNLQVDTGNGIENDGSDNLRINPAEIAGNALVEDTVTTLGIATDGIQADELDTTVAFTFTNLQTIQRSPGVGSADVLSLADGDTGDELRFSIDASDRFVIQAFDTSTNNVRDLLRVSPDTDQVDVVSTLNFPNLTGTPSFDTHTHSEGGLAQIPNTGLVNNTVTFTSGTGLTGGGSVSLGSTASLDVGGGSFITANADDVAVNITNGLEGDGSDNIRVSGGAVADGFLSEGTNPHQISVNIVGGLESDGSNNIRVQGDAISGAFLSEGINAFETSVNIGNGLEGDGSDNIRINPSEIAGNGLVEDTATTLGIPTDGIGTDELDTSVSFNFTAAQDIAILEPGSGTSDIFSLTDATSSDELRFKLTDTGVFTIRAFDSSAAVERDLISVDPANDQVIYPSDILPPSAGTQNVGTSTTFFNEMHATTFITHSPEARSFGDAWQSLTEYESGSMQIDEKMADVIEVVKGQKELIEKQQERIEQLEAKL